MKALSIIIAATMVATLAACGTPPPVTAPQSPSSDAAPPMQEVDRNTIYTVSVDDNEELSFDSDGNVVENPKDGDDGWVTLSDLVTGTETYKIHTKTEDTGANDEWNNPIVSTTTALYTLDGKLLYGYSDYTYDSGVGGLLIRKHHRGRWSSFEDIPKDFKSSLWNPVTGEMVQPNIASMTQLDKDKGTFAVFNVFGTLLGTMDATGKMIKTSNNTYYTKIVDDRIVSRNTEWEDYSGEEQYTMYDYDLNPIVTAEYIGGDSSWEDYRLFEYRDKDEMGIMDVDGNRLLVLPQDDEPFIDFCDGELLIIRKREGESVLMKLDGTKVGGAYDQIEPICPDKYNLTEPPTQFLVRSGDTLSIVDRQGTVLHTATVSGLAHITKATGKHIIYSTDTQYSGLLDMAFSVVIPADKYTSIYQPGWQSHNNRIPSDLYVGQYYPLISDNGQIDYSVLRMDIYNSNIEPIADSLTRIGTVGKGRIAVVRGFNAGVIDWQGNWMGKTSIFQTVSDERKVDYF